MLLARLSTQMYLKVLVCASRIQHSPFLAATSDCTAFASWLICSARSAGFFRGARFQELLPSDAYKPFIFSYFPSFCLFLLFVCSSVAFFSFCCMYLHAPLSFLLSLGFQCSFHLLYLIFQLISLITFPFLIMLSYFYFLLYCLHIYPLIFHSSF